MASPPPFYSLWQKEAVRERLFELLSKEDICAVRVANSACCNLVTKRLFLRTSLTFTASTFTRPSRVQALSRIGHHVEHLTFCLPHSEATFLPPLVHPLTGREICFLYAPHTSMASVLARPKYGNTELGDILTQQYPPLFHAATNVPSFINALRHLPNMRHLTVKTPGQHPDERYRRDIVDYALVSLRIALERAPLLKLAKLSLSAVHPSAFVYLRPLPGFGCSPSGPRRWRQIRKLYISVEAWDFYGPSPGLDHLKIIDDYIRLFAPRVDKLCFAWLGRKGPCPLALAADPLFSSPPANTHKLFAEVTSPMSPLPPRPQRRPLHMPRVRYLQVRNATMNVAQLRDLLSAHKSTVREFGFDDVVLINHGSWDDALAPLRDSAGTSDVWCRRSLGGSETTFRHAAPGHTRTGPGPSDLSRSGSSRSRGGPPSLRNAPSLRADDEVLLPTSSAAALAASRELFDVDLDGMVFGGANDANVDALEAGVEEWARGVTAAAQKEVPVEGPVEEPTVEGPVVEEVPIMVPIAEAPVEALPETVAPAPKAQDKERETKPPLPPDIPTAEGVSTTLKKKRRVPKKKSTRHRRRDDSEAAETADERRSERHRHRHNRSRSQSQAKSQAKSQSKSKTQTKTQSQRKNVRGRRVVQESRGRNRSRKRSPSRQRHGDHNRSPNHSRRRQRNRSPEPELPEIPNAFLSEPPPSYAEHNARSADHAARARRPPTPPPDMGISAPILKSDPLPVMLQPTIYDPSAKAGPFLPDSPLSKPSTPPPPPPSSWPPSRSSPSTRSTPPSRSSPPPRPSLSKTPSIKSLMSSSTLSRSFSARAAMGPERRIRTRRSEDDGLSAVQRSIEAELRMAEADEEAARSSALRRAKETVLAKLSREFSKRGGSRNVPPRGKESAAVTGLATGYSSRDAGPVSLGSRLFGHRAAHHGEEHKSLESQTALVPLIFSRS